MEAWSVHHLFEKAEINLGAECAARLQQYAQRLINAGLPVIFSLGHLAEITQSDYNMLRDTINRKRETANYKMFATKKRSGGRRFIHAVSGTLSPVLHFLNTQVLQKTSPHPCSFAYHRNGGIRKCAGSHCGARWLFQFDLKHFFYDVSEIDVFHVFEEMGYRRLLAFELARLCTTTHLPKRYRNLLHRRGEWWDNRGPYWRNGLATGVLPQGAPTSPMLSNLVAWKLDDLLCTFSLAHGFVYTRYADDLTLSARNLPKDMPIGRIHRSVIHAIRSCGFRENPKKTRIAGPGSKKIVLGLLVDGTQPRISRETYRRIDRLLYASGKFGVAEVAEHEGFDSAYGFHNHLSGLIVFVKDVDRMRWAEFHNRLSELKTPISQG